MKKVMLVGVGGYIGGKFTEYINTHYPDWQIDAVDSMKDLANFVVSDFCQCHTPEGQPKFDIADYIQQKRMALIDTVGSDS